MEPFRIALANLRFPPTREDSVVLAAGAIHEAARGGARLVAFPECFVPGYRAPERNIAPPDASFLDRAHATLAEASARAKITSVIGTERIVDGVLRATAIVIADDGTIAGFQDKVQIDPAEEGIYTPG